jgi:hypothetical protein
MPEISLAAEDAAELADFLRFLGEWLATDHSQLSDSLARLMDGHPYELETLRHDLPASRPCSAATTASAPPRSARVLGSGTCHRLATIVVAKRELPDELAPVPRSGQRGATWPQLSAAMGTGNRQTAQKRHSGLGIKPQMT